MLPLVLCSALRDASAGVWPSVRIRTCMPWSIATSTNPISTPSSSPQEGNTPRPSTTTPPTHPHLSSPAAPFTPSAPVFTDLSPSTSTAPPLQEPLATSPLPGRRTDASPRQPASCPPESAEEIGTASTRCTAYSVVSAKRRTTECSVSAARRWPTKPELEWATAHHPGAGDRAVAVVGRFSTSQQRTEASNLASSSNVTKKHRTV
mmetsp:Transcript_27552/g.71488  ORF Transcript_27552/g.71488 Transcript_27552/m.71488 type:complete len:206 (+) Transcript_27552:650-1267(+)